MSRKKSTPYAEEFKRSSAQLAFESEQSIKNTEKYLSINPSTLYTWVEKYYPEAHTATSHTSVHEELKAVTLQLGCPHTIAVKTGITVVSDFRTRDMVLGGQGAPLAPYYHHELFKKHALPLALVNVGGIANLTVLDNHQAPRGYDTGPGNVLMDTWIQTHQQRAYDGDGSWALSGHVIEPLLERLLQDAYFQKAAPKSVDKAYFSNTWLQPYLETSYKSEG